MAHYWTTQPIPVVTVPEGAPARCTCADFAAAGTCQHATDAQAREKKLDEIEFVRWVDSRAATRAAVHDDMEEMTEEELTVFYKRVLLLRLRFWRPASNN